MRVRRLSKQQRVVLGIAIGSVWLFHGCYSKMLDGIPRHRLIIARVLGEGIASPAILLIGAIEVLLGVWVWTGRYRRVCALVQTLAIALMNLLEITFARDLLISAPGMIVLNIAFLSLVWWWASSEA